MMINYMNHFFRHMQMNSRSEEFFGNKTFPLAGLIDHNENVCRMQHEFNDVMQVSWVETVLELESTEEMDLRTVKQICFL